MSKHTKTRVIAMEVPCCHDCIIDCSKCSRLWARCAKTYRLILISNTHFAIEQSIGKHAMRLEQTKSEVEHKIKTPAELEAEATAAAKAEAAEAEDAEEPAPKAAALADPGDNPDSDSSGEDEAAHREHLRLKKEVEANEAIDELPSLSSARQLPAAYIALERYPADEFDALQKDEIGFELGDTVMVESFEPGNGWWTGTIAVHHTTRTGKFPAKLVAAQTPDSGLTFQPFAAVMKQEPAFFGTKAFQRRGMVAGTIADTHWVSLHHRNISCARVLKRMWAGIFLAAAFALPFAMMVTQICDTDMDMSLALSKDSYDGPPAIGDSWFSNDTVPLAGPPWLWCKRVAEIGRRPDKATEEALEIRIPAICRYSVEAGLLAQGYNLDGAGVPGNIAYTYHMDPETFQANPMEW